MLKYVNTGIVFQEVPDEVTLAINISGCPCRCPGCHSRYLWEDIGKPLDAAAIDHCISTAAGDITCVAFMGGDADPAAVNSLARHVHQAHPRLRVAWYSGRIRIPATVNKTDFDYIKTGPYIKHLGPLNKPTTNQQLFRVEADGQLTDITYRFWKKDNL